MKNMKKKKTRAAIRPSRLVLYALFAVYCVTLLLLLFVLNRSTADASYAELLELKANFRPFNTVRLLFWDLKHGAISPFDLVWNLVGNLLAFLPLAMSLPCLLRPLRRWWRTDLAVAGVVVLVEAAQLLTKRGMIDVDDLILNTLGAVIGYALICIPPFRRLLVRIGWWVE